MVDVNWNYSFEEYALWCSIENSFQFGFIFGERMEIYPNTQVLIKTFAQINVFEQSWWSRIDFYHLDAHLLWYGKTFHH